MEVAGGARRGREPPRLAAAPDRRIGDRRVEQQPVDGIDLAGLGPWLDSGALADADLAEEVAEDAAYAPYLARQDAELRDLRASEALPLGDTFPYETIPGLSREMVERLSRARPATLAAAGRVAGG